MKKTLILLCGIFISACGGVNQDPVQLEAAMDVIERVAGGKPENIELKLTGKDRNGCDRFTTRSKGGKLYIEGSSGVALCRGFYDYVTSNRMGVYTWSLKNITLPGQFPDVPEKSVTTPFRLRPYMNVCTFGYTTPYWDWERWQQELDWMALHGFNMPLAPVASEAILARVWKEMGLTDEEIGVLFTAPGHFPWMRMGNMSGLDGPLSQEWHDFTIGLQHKIVDRMNSLGMTPLFNGFAGFVPPAIKKIYPEAELIETKWAGFKNWMIAATEPAFSEIGTKYIREWEKEFGKGEYYLADSFNEMDIPFAGMGTQERFDQLAHYSRTIYNSIKDANPDAVWVIQGWMFGYQRKSMWDPASIEGLLAGAPDDKMLIIDLAVDFNKFVWKSPFTWDYTGGLYGKQWVYSTVPNFGGRTGMTGNLEFLLNGHLEALASPNKGNLTGYGTSPEGVENNDVLYEAITAAAWSREKIDVNEWARNYAANRYGSCPESIAAFWDKMIRSSYSVFTNRAIYKIQRRPYHHRRHVMDLTPTHFEALESFFGAYGELGGNPAYMADLAQYAGFYAAGKADILTDVVNRLFLMGKKDEVKKYEKEFFELLNMTDRFLESYPDTRLERWIGYARARGTSPGESDHYEHNARRLITIWGDPGHSLNDYACRLWSGLIRDYYVKRWQHYFESKHNQTPHDFNKLEGDWVNGFGISAAEPYPDIAAAVKELVDKYSYINYDLVGQGVNEQGGWSPFEFHNEKARIVFKLFPEQLPEIKGVRFTYLRGTAPVKVKQVTVTSEGSTIAAAKPELVIDPTDGVADIELIPETDKGRIHANGYLNITLESAPNADTFGMIEIIR